MKAVCPNCQGENVQSQINTTEEISIRGEMIPIEVHYLHCEECGEDYEIPDPDYDPLEEAYREYRSRKGMVQPEELKAFRKKYGFTQKDLSNILGIGIATLNRYEHGALQSEAHDQAIKLCMQPENLRKILEDKPNLLSASSRERVFQSIKTSKDSCGNLLDKAIEQFGSYPPNISSGYLRFDAHKFFQMMKFFCYGEEVVKTKLLKLLFYADFKYFKENEVSISGAHYAHGFFGPVPDKFDTWLVAATQWNNEIRSVEKVFHNYVGEYFNSDQPDWSVFSPSELSTLHEIKQYFKNYNAKQIRNFSHQEKGYIQTVDGEIISYQYAEDLQI